jgi:drug/metabolite transporter (DMT)-like permease
MPPSTSSNRGETEAGMLFMAGAMLLVPGIDALAKLLSAQLSPFQITFIRFLLQAAFLGGLLAWSRRLAVPRSALPRLALGGTFVAAAIGFLVWSLSILPLANAIAIFFVEPLVLSLLSALFLGERVGWQRLGAVAVGLIGALVVIRPNWAQFGAAALLPLFAAVFYAAQLTVFRSLSGDLSGPRVQAYSAIFATLVLGIALLLGGAAGVDQFAWHRPRGVAWAYLAGIGVLSTISYLLISSALKRTEAGTLAPFQYLEIISATILGYLVFGDFPDLLTWLGTGIILASGLYVFYRERKRA